MDSKYIITPSGTFINTDELYHWGIKGMKWGIRRYQNPDGSLTAAGRKRYTNPDGTLNKKGEKYIAKETARLKSEKTKLENQIKTNSQLEKLDKMRQINQNLNSQASGKKDTNVEEKNVSEKTSEKKKEVDFNMNSLTDNEVNATRNRLQSEDQLADLLRKRGYNISLDQRSEIDDLIDSLSKEKKVVELKRDVEKLTKGKSETEKRIEILEQKRDVLKLEKEIRDNTPKKENKLSKFMNSEAGKTLAKQLITSGENIIISALKSNNGDTSKSKDNSPNNNKNNAPNKNNDSNKTKSNNVSEAGAKVVVDALSKTVGKEAKKVAKSVQKQQARQAKKESKAAEKEARQEAKELDNLISKASKNSSSYYNSKAYEEKVDKLLAEMDDRAWDIYYSKYANK